MKTTVKHFSKETKVQKTLGQLVFEVEQIQKTSNQKPQNWPEYPKYDWR